tara:strand:+ start:187 stop:645 length:459 start_codon:yes stop_codon:yes gene_type:complete
MGQKRSLTIGRGEKTMAKLSFLTKVYFNYMAVGRAPFSQDDFQKIQIRLLIQDQNHPGGDETIATREHQLQRRHLAVDPQSQELVTAGMVELHWPGFCTTAVIQDLPQNLLQISVIQQGKTLWPNLTLKRGLTAIKHKSQHSLGRCGEGVTD